jgi:hypothetical protein
MEKDVRQMVATGIFPPEVIVEAVGIHLDGTVIFFEIAAVPKRRFEEFDEPLCASEKGIVQNERFVVPYKGDFQRPPERKEGE